MRLLLAANNQATRRNEIIKSYYTFNWVQAAIDMHPACPNKKPNHLQNSFLRRTQFWVRKTFSKPASLKRASLVALPAAISHKASLKPKRCASATLIQQTSKNEPKHGPKNGTAWRSHFWDRMHRLVKKQKKSSFTVSFLGPSGGTKNETAKSQNQQQRPTRATNKKWQLRLVKQQAYRVGTVALPAAISHKASLKPKRCASATLIQQTSKNEPKHGPKNGTAWRSHFWDRMHRLVKKQKKSSFTVSFLGPSGGTKNETAKSQNQQQRPTRATNKKWQLRLVKQQAYRVGTGEARTCEAWFQLTFRPQKWNLKAHMWYQLSPFTGSTVAIAMKHHPGNIHQSFATPRYLPYSALCFDANTQCNWHSISKRWRSKKTFNTFTFPHLSLTRFLLHPVLN